MTTGVENRPRFGRKASPLVHPWFHFVYPHLNILVWWYTEQRKVFSARKSSRNPQKVVEFSHETSSVKKCWAKSEISHNFLGSEDPKETLIYVFKTIVKQIFNIQTSSVILNDCYTIFLLQILEFPWSLLSPENCGKSEGFLGLNFSP